MTDAEGLSFDWVTDEITRFDLWARFVNDHKLRDIAEIGVFRGEFAQAILDGCPDVASYHMIDPWRHLDDWNKPLNRADPTFAEWYEQTMQRTEAHADKRIVLRGTTVEVIDRIQDESLDFAYVDGDHTLRGITIDLVRVWPKIRPGAFLAGDDFARSIWQHKEEFEPTLVFPFAVHFAEAVGAPIYALPHNQYVIHKVTGHRFVDRTGRYTSTELRDAMQARGGRKTARDGRRLRRGDEH